MWLAARGGAGAAGNYLDLPLDLIDREDLLTVVGGTVAQCGKAVRRVCVSRGGAACLLPLATARARLQLSLEARDEVLLLLAQLICRADLVVDVPLLLQRRMARHEKARPKVSHTHTLHGPLQQSRHSLPRLHYSLRTCCTRRDSVLAVLNLALAMPSSEFASGRLLSFLSSCSLIVDSFSCSLDIFSSSTEIFSFMTFCHAGQESAQRVR